MSCTAEALRKRWLLVLSSRWPLPTSPEARLHRQGCPGKKAEGSFPRLLPQRLSRAVQLSCGCCSLHSLTWPPVWARPRAGHRITGAWDGVPVPRTGSGGGWSLTAESLPGAASPQNSSHPGTGRRGQAKAPPLPQFRTTLQAQHTPSAAVGPAEAWAGLASQPLRPRPSPVSPMPHYQR